MAKRYALRREEVIEAEQFDGIHIPSVLKEALMNLEVYAVRDTGGIALHIDVGGFRETVCKKGQWVINQRPRAHYPEISVMNDDAFREKYEEV